MNFRHYRAAGQRRRLTRHSLLATLALGVTSALLLVASGASALTPWWPPQPVPAPGSSAPANPTLRGFSTPAYAIPGWSAAGDGGIVAGSDYDPPPLWNAAALYQPAPVRVRFTHNPNGAVLGGSGVCDQLGGTAAARQVIAPNDHDWHDVTPVPGQQMPVCVSVSGNGVSVSGEVINYGTRVNP
ncbi:MAG: hypothetical protein ACRCYQ_09160 [Nocardioides sp.]